jgi:Protein of unknown function DUF2625
MVKAFRKINLLLFFLIPFCSLGQVKMRPIDELINTKEPGWNLLEKMIDSATNKVEVLPILNIDSAKNSLFRIQVTTRSPMGAIVYQSGGIIIENGWIRILGSGSEKLQRSLPNWNKGKTFTNFGEPMSQLLIADDAVGGFFVLNGGALGDDLGKVYYLAPESLEYEPLGISYTEFLLFCFSGDLKTFYSDKSWKESDNEVALLDPDNVICFYPFLWSEDSKDINSAKRSSVSIEEWYQLTMKFREEILNSKK